jgi:hypothetical protein
MTLPQLHKLCYILSNGKTLLNKNEEGYGRKYSWTTFKYPWQNFIIDTKDTHVKSNPSPKSHAEVTSTLSNFTGAYMIEYGFKSSFRFSKLSLTQARIQWGLKRLERENHFSHFQVSSLNMHEAITSLPYASPWHGVF